MRIILSIVGAGVLLVTLPVINYEWIKPNRYLLDPEAFVSGSLQNITEKQLVKTGYTRSWAGTGMIEFTGTDTVFFPKVYVPVTMAFQFVNGQKMPDSMVSADRVLSPTRPDIFHPVLARLTYDARSDSAMLGLVNRLFRTDIVPAPLSIDEMPELVFTAQWQDSTGTRPVLHYIRAAHWQQSMLRIPVGRTRVHAWISWYVRTVYQKLPRFLQPKWYRIISSPLIPED